MKKIIKCTLQWSRGSTAKKNLHKQTKRGIRSEASSEPFFAVGSRLFVAKLQTGMKAYIFLCFYLYFCLDNTCHPQL